MYQDLNAESPDAPEARPSRKRKLAVFGLVAVAIVAVGLLAFNVFAGGGNASTGGTDAADPYAVTFDGDNFSGDKASTVKTEPVAQRDSEEKYASACASCAKKHEIAAMPAASATTHVAEGAPNSKELKKLLKEQKKNSKIATGDQVTLLSDGSASAPIGAPDPVNAVVAAGNVIKNYPYIWGGGHASFQANGYDCSGSVSYALKAANLVSEPMVSGDFENWGEPGPGKWITVMANAGHVYMYVGGVRYDTSFRDGPYGTRWHTDKRSDSGFVVRHPAGL